MGRKENRDREKFGEVREVLLDSFNVPFSVGIDNNDAYITCGI